MKRAGSLLLCVAMLVGILSGCSKTQQPETTASQTEQAFTPRFDQETAGEIRIGGVFKNFEALEAIFEDFAEYYPNVVTTYFSVDNQSDVLNKVISGAEAPDIIFSNSYIFDYDNQYDEVQKHAAVLSDPKLDIDLGVINDELLLRNENGDVVFYPAYILSSGVMVNEKILADNDIALPTTYSEFLDACKKLQKLGYAKPVMGNSSGDGWEDLYPSMAQGFFLNSVYQNKEAIEAINNRASGSAEYFKSTLEFVEDFVKQGFIDQETSASLEDGYESAILRFFEGDIPFMFTNANTMTGTAKRESKSEKFQAEPFDYCFMPFPYDEQGGTLPVLDIFGFTVNNEGPNKELAEEFVRFLSQTDILNKFCDIKGAPRITKNAEQTSRLAPLTAYADRIECGGQASLKRNEVWRVRQTINMVGQGNSIEDAIAAYYAG